MAMGILGHTTAQAQVGGVPLWVNRYNGTADRNDYAYAVAVDGSGNVIVTGGSRNGNYFGSDYVTIKYSGAGVPLWTNRYNGPGFDENAYAHAVAVDTNGNVFVTGYSDYGNAATIAYSGAGVPLWTNRFSGSGRAVAVDGSGNVFVTGSSGADYATIKYSGADVALWTNRYNGPGNGSALAGLYKLVS